MLYRKERIPMAFHKSNRHQAIMFPEAIEDYVPLTSPVRVYDAFVEALDFEALGIRVTPLLSGGADEYYPKDILKLLIYGPSYGVRSSRKLERACHDNISFIWLMGGLKPDYRTIARFRVKYKKEIKKVLKQCVQMCIKMNLIEGNILFVDESKVRANASINKSWNKKRCEKHIKKIEKNIDRLMDECEQVDQQEKGFGSLVRLKERIQDKESLVNQIKDVLKDLEGSDKKSINTTDEDSVKAKSRQGTHAAHNVQNTVDQKHGLIVNSECVSQSNDYNQLNRQVNNATEIMGKTPKTICADAGYAAVADLKEINDGINVVVPSKKQAQEAKGIKELGPFDRSRFIYHEQEDEYECPAGERLTNRGNGNGKYDTVYKTLGGICRACRYFGECTNSKKMGRKIMRSRNEEHRIALEKNYLKKKNQDIYALRKQTVEHPFGHLKKNLGVHQFLLRGTAKVDGEIAILSTCFNIRRLMTIVGIPELLLRLKTI